MTDSGEAEGGPKRGEGWGGPWGEVKDKGTSHVRGEWWAGEVPRLWLTYLLPWLAWLVALPSPHCKSPRPAIYKSPSAQAGGDYPYKLTFVSTVFREMR